MADLVTKTFNQAEMWPFKDFSEVDANKDPRLKKLVVGALYSLSEGRGKICINDISVQGFLDGALYLESRGHVERTGENFNIPYFSFFGLTTQGVAYASRVFDSVNLDV